MIKCIVALYHRVRELHNVLNAGQLNIEQLADIVLSPASHDRLSVLQISLSHGFLNIYFTTLQGTRRHECAQQTG